MAKKIEKLVRANGPAYITGSLREEFNPYVLFDAGLVETKESSWGFDWHPHSGVATLTIPFKGDLSHEDTSGGKGIVKENGFQWMQAGNGIWHKEIYSPKNNQVGVMQLWLRLGPEVEVIASSYYDETPDEIATSDNTRIMIGEFKGVKSNKKVPVDMTHLDVTLKKGESWSFEVPSSQKRGFVYPIEGSVTVEGEKVETFVLGKLLETDEESILTVTANEDARFIVSTAEPGKYPLVAQSGQVHTTKEALLKGRENIIQIGKDKQFIR